MSLIWCDHLTHILYTVAYCSFAVTRILVPTTNTIKNNLCHICNQCTPCQHQSSSNTSDSLVSYNATYYRLSNIIKFAIHIATLSINECILHGNNLTSTLCKIILVPSYFHHNIKTNNQMIMAAAVIIVYKTAILYETNI